MARTFAEKALARAAGLADARVGQIVDARPDCVLSHDNTAPIWKTFKQLGVDKVRYPERLRITLDHAVPAPTTQHAQNHAEVRRFVAEQGVRHFWEAGRGICHQVLSEEAAVLPGQTIVGSDSHTTHYGWLGAFGAGIGRSEVAALWATGELWMRVPETLRITLTGHLRPGATAKDFCLKMIGDLGQDGGLYASIEFGGPGVAGLSLESRMVLPNMMAEFGAKNAYLPPDAAVFDYLRARLLARDARWRAEGGPGIAGVDALCTTLEEIALYPDPDAAVLAEHVYDLRAIEPMVARPHRVDNVQPVSAVKGTPIQQAFLGTCTNGRLEDFEAALAVLRGRRVARGTRLLVIPASSEVLAEAMRRGWINDFIDAGAVIGVPGCGPCMGNHMGVPAIGEATISTANRNFRGRMGTRDSDIYLASPAVVAASAIAGAIADPADV
ncbi:MAG: 3-isopropylmalate dehydratase large subunit [Thermoflexales bacterium]|nr:3-isopropylmalate dehydratase large subunit [Thermoflexales bacterium]